MHRGIVISSALVAALLGAAAPRLLADEGRREERLAALVSELKKPDGFRAAYKLVDAGAAAVPDLLSKLGGSSLGDERIEACLREITRTKEGAKAAIEKLGQARSPLTRARLARALAHAQVVEAVYPLVEALDEVQEPLEVTAWGPLGTRARDTMRIAKPVSQACASFGEKASAAIRKRLAKRDSPLFRIEAAWVLGATRSAAAAPDLVVIAQDEKRTPDKRAAAIRALGSMRSPAGRSVFAGALASDSSIVRGAAIRALAAVPDPSALPALARLLEEAKDDDDLRLACVRALAALEDPLAFAPLKAALEEAPRVGASTRVAFATACAQGVAATNDGEGSGALVASLEAGLGFVYEHAAAAALARIPMIAPDARSRLRNLASDHAVPPGPRACAAWILAQRGEEDALAALLALAKHKAYGVRANMAVLLGEGKLDGTVPALLAMTADEEATVRRAAVVALGKHEASIAGAAFVRAARHLDQDPGVRRAYAAGAPDMLAQSTLDAESRRVLRAQLVEALERDAKDASFEERRAQAGSLAALGERAGLLRVATAAFASSPLPADARRAAIEALGRMGRNDATEEALSGLVRDAALGDDAAFALAELRNETFFEPAWRERLAPPIPFR